MSQKAKIAVYFAGKEVIVPAEVEYFNQQERLKKGAQAFGICWLVAILCLPIPVLHLVIPPIALLMGPIMGLFVYSKVKKLPKKVTGDVACGNCQANSHFEFIEAKPPLFEACAACRTGYEVLWPPRSEDA